MYTNWNAKHWKETQMSGYYIWNTAHKKTCFCDNEMFSKLSFILEIYSKNKPIYSLDNKDIQKVALEIGGKK